jgi:competence ComEA-like helix-hairpin-helix protein
VGGCTENVAAPPLVQGEESYAARRSLTHRPLALLALLTLLAASASAQVPPTEVPEDTLAVPNEIDARFEALVEDELAGDPTALLELLTSLRTDPLDVNAATAEELAQIPAFTPTLAAAIVRYRERNGPFTSLPLLQQVEGMTSAVYLDARPYLAAGPPLAGPIRLAPRFPEAPSVSEVVSGLRYAGIQRVQQRLDTPAGYLGPDSLRTYPGSPARIYTRVGARYRRQVSVNVTLEKDPGEPFRFDEATNTYGYDYVSAHAAVLDAGRIDALIVGDFVAEFGQGVALWRASGFGKGPDAVQGPIRSGRGFRPYGSVDENNFFRGAALTLAATPNVYVSAFASRRALDASVFTPDSSDVFDPDLPPGALTGPIVTSLNATGLHRTDRELARKDALDETLVGGGVEGRVSTGSLEGRAGVVATRSQFSTLLAAGTRPDEFFDFAGDEATVVSVYADAKTRAGQAFGEVASGAGGGLGGVAGVGADLGGGADLLVVGRHYAADFTSLHGYPFGERNGVGRNETGLYVGARVRPAATWTVDAYLDQYRFPFLRFNVPRPSRGVEALARVEHRPRRYLRVYAQARTETREVGIDVPNAVPGSVVGGLAEATRQTLRLHGEWDANRRLRLRARVEGSRYLDAEDDAPVQTGSLVYQDVRWQALGWLRTDVRLTLFDTDGYDARLYAFENDLTGVFSIPALSGRGVRGYVLLTAEPVENLVAQVKLAATWFRNVRRVGSGANEVEGGRVRDLGVQLRYRF